MANGIVSQWPQRQPLHPYTTVGIALVCVILMGLYSTLTPMMQQLVIEVGGMQPAAMHSLFEQPVGDWWTPSLLALFSALFIHANWLHLLGNLAYLLVFGFPVEQRLGSIATLAVFLIGGALANVIVSERVDWLETPIIGASGAISAVVGAYLGLFPRGRIGLYIPLGLYMQFARVPALLVIGSWFTLQLLYTAFGPINENVALWTHLTGFALGLMFALMVRALAQVRFN
ncbi:MAG TPA: rhomboid family intramembrane serine protease [Xanthomonadales bacterium]|nr:rhomboid family intramembrane serine protease [Xanthomonadales bacterium]